MVIISGIANNRHMAQLTHFTGGGQKLRTGSLVLPVADNIFK